jgi:hypothetical protein
MRQAQPIGVAASEVSTMLWPNAQTGLSSPLIVASLTIKTRVLWDLRGDTVRVTPLVVTDTGESVNENKIVTSHRQVSTGFAIEGNNSEKDGIPSRGAATQAIKTGRASLSGQAAALQLWKLAFTASQN